MTTERIIYESFNKSKISALPQVLFDGRIIVVETAESANNCVEYLLQQPILGIDTETRPSFKKGFAFKVSLLQISTHEECFLFRLNKMGLPAILCDLLANNKQLKVGLSLKDDIAALHERAAFVPGKYVDLQNYVVQLGITDMSLQKLYANVFCQRISKSVRLSNWESSVLTEAQKRYAATDAWACIKLYEELKRLRKRKDYQFVRSVNLDVMSDEIIRGLLNELTNK